MEIEMLDETLTMRLILAFIRDIWSIMKRKA
jgi:hypothetical protein